MENKPKNVLDMKEVRGPIRRLLALPWRGEGKGKAEFQTLLIGYEIGGRETKPMTLPELQAHGLDWSNVS